MYASFLSETRRGTDQERLNSGFKFSQLEMSAFLSFGHAFRSLSDPSSTGRGRSGGVAFYIQV